MHTTISICVFIKTIWLVILNNAPLITLPCLLHVKFYNIMLNMCNCKIIFRCCTISWLRHVLRSFTFDCLQNPTLLCVILAGHRKSLTDKQLLYVFASNVLASYNFASTWCYTVTFFYMTYDSYSQFIFLFFLILICFTHMNYSVWNLCVLTLRIAWFWHLFL